MASKHTQVLKMRVYTATEIANMVPWQGEYVPLEDVKALLERITPNEDQDLEEPFDVELG